MQKKINALDPKIKQTGTGTEAWTRPVVDTSTASPYITKKVSPALVLEPKQGNKDKREEEGVHVADAAFAGAHVTGRGRGRVASYVG